MTNAYSRSAGQCRARLLTSALVVLAGCTPQSTTDSTSSRGPESGAAPPNIVIILADDLGWRDVSFNGGDIATPNIDRIATEGVKLSRFYTAPVCTPTRAGLMTGRYPIRAGLMRAVIPPWRDFGLDTDEMLMPEFLAQAGYEHRAIIGKWHLGHTEARFHPLRRGFTHFIGHYNGSIDYFSHEREGERDWHHGTESVDEPGYATDLIADHAVAFIDRNTDARPFFLYVPFGSVHTPLQAKQIDLPRYAELSGIPQVSDGPSSGRDEEMRGADQRRKSRRILAAMTHSMDQGIGRILDSLERNDVADNTFVLFFSDNGGVGGLSDNRPFRGSKGTVFEGGTRVAAAARWPSGGIRGGGAVEAPIAYLDILPTLLNIIGGDAPLAAKSGKPFDGIDVIGSLTRTAPATDRELYSFTAQRDPDVEQVSVIDPRWKLVVVGPPLTQPDAVEESSLSLFSINDDPEEQHDLAGQEKEVSRRLLEKAIAFRELQPASHVPPYSEGRQGFKPPKDWRIRGL